MIEQMSAKPVEVIAAFVNPSRLNDENEMQFKNGDIRNQSSNFLSGERTLWPMIARFLQTPIVSELRNWQTNFLAMCVSLVPGSVGSGSLAQVPLRGLTGCHGSQHTRVAERSPVHRLERPCPRGRNWATSFRVLPFLARRPKEVAESSLPNLSSGLRLRTLCAARIGPRAERTTPG